MSGAAEEKFPNPDRPSDVAADAYKDITVPLRGWLRELPPGHTCLDRGFTMEDAMHGWEVLSPKMDTGVGYAATSVAAEVAARELGPAEVLGAMDRALAVELVFYRGYCSSHTLATCHLLVAPALARDPLLRLTLRAALSSVHAVLALVRAAEISFEEELVRVTPDFPLDQEDPGDRPALLAELAAAEAALAPAAKAGDEGAAALRLRLGLRRALLELLVAASEAGDARHPSVLRERVAALGAAAGRLAGRLDPSAAPAWAFEEHVVRRDLGAATPARAIPALDGPGLERELAALGADVAAVAAAAPERGATLEETVALAVLFGLRRPCVLARAVLKRFLTSGERIMGQPAHAAAAHFLAQLKVPRHHLQGAPAAKLLEAQALTLQYLLANLCMNPARQRRRLRGLLAEASQLLHAGAELDRALATEMERRRFHRFFTFVQVLVCSLFSLQMLRLGSALGLYETDELPAVYWAIWHFHRELSLWKEQVDAAKVKDDKKAAGGKKKGASSAASAAVKPRVLTYLDMVRSAEEHVARGVYLTFLAARAGGQYVPPVYEMQPPEARWQLRFGCLPLFLTFERFAETVAADGRAPAAALLEQALEAYRVAKQRLEAAAKSRGQLALEAETSYWRSLTRVAVINTLNLQTLQPDAPPGLSVDWSHNSFFPAISFAKKS